MITVIDDRMGASKTSAMIQFMNTNKSSKKFIFVTPFLDEVQRIKDYCGFVEPEKTDYKNKLDSFKELILSNVSVVTTHSLFKIMDIETIEILKQKDYILVLDEVLDVIAETSLSKTEVDVLVDLGILIRDENGELISGSEQVLNKYTGDWDYVDIVNNLLRHTLEFYRGYKTKSNGEKVALMWLFPIDLLKAFDNIFILTYYFDGYPLKYYLDIHKIPQNKMSVEVLNPEAEYEDRRYKFIPYRQRSNSDIKPKVKILNGNVINNIGEPETAFSVTWYKTIFPKSEINIQLKKNILNITTNRFKHSKIDDIMWTTFISNQHSFYTERLKEVNFLPHNIRATNEYKHKKSLIYLVNKKYNPVIYQWFKDKGIIVNEKQYALAELIQWIFRSAIREGENIEVYIPSARMRRLFIEWLDL